MNVNTPTYSWNDKIRLTYPPDRCMNKISPFLRLINYIAGEGGGLPGCMILYILWGADEVGKRRSRD